MSHASFIYGGIFCIPTVSNFRLLNLVNERLIESRACQLWLRLTWPREKKSISDGSILNKE